MSYGSGHVFDMINRMKQNRALRGSNRQKFKKNSSHLYKTQKSESPFLKKYSKEKIEQVRSEIINKANKINKKQEIVFWSFITFGVIFIILFLIYF